MPGERPRIDHQSAVPAPLHLNTKSGPVLYWPRYPVVPNGDRDAKARPAAEALGIELLLIGQRFHGRVWDLTVSAWSVLPLRQAVGLVNGGAAAVTEPEG